MRTLVSYEECLLSRFKECDNTVRKYGESLQEYLNNELMQHFIEEFEDCETGDATEDGLIYYLCGYLLKTRKWAIDCNDCRPKMLTSEDFLPGNFQAADYTLSTSCGGLKLATPAMFIIF